MSVLFAAIAPSYFDQSITFTAPAGATRALAIIKQVGSVPDGALTLGGVAMSPVDDVPNWSYGGFSTVVFELANPPSGAGTVLQVTNGTVRGLGVIYLDGAGAIRGTPVLLTTTETTNDPSAVLTTVSGDQCVLLVAVNQNGGAVTDIVATGGSTRNAVGSTDGIAAAILTQTATGTSTTIAADVQSTVAHSWGAIAVALQPSGGATPTIVLTPTSRTFFATAGGAVPGAETVAVTNGGGGALMPTLGATSYGPGASGWLSASYAAGTVTLQPTTTALAAGTYTATVPVQDAGASNSPQTISLTYTVSAGAASPAWSAVSGATITPTTDALYTRHGGRALRVQAAASGQGIQSPQAPIMPTTHSPFFSGFLVFWLVSGQVRFELVTNDGEVWPDKAGQKAWSNAVGRWTELGVEGIDLTGKTGVTLRLVADGGAAEWYVDAGQLTQSASNEPLVEGSGATALWQEANRQLAARAQPTTRVDLDLVDLAAIDPKWATIAAGLGDQCRVVDPDVPVLAETRILELSRELLEDTALKLTLSSRPEDFIDTLVRPRPGARKPRGEPADDGPRLLTFEFTGFTDSAGGALSLDEYIHAGLQWTLSRQATDALCDLRIYQSFGGGYNVLWATITAPVSQAMPYRMGILFRFDAGQTEKPFGWKAELVTNGQVVDVKYIPPTYRITSYDAQ